MYKDIKLVPKTIFHKDFGVSKCKHMIKYVLLHLFLDFEGVNGVLHTYMSRMVKKNFSCFKVRTVLEYT